MFIFYCALQSPEMSLMIKQLIEKMNKDKIELLIEKLNADKMNFRHN